MNCYCCGAEITVPQFHNGKAYGWTCILKVAPGFRRTKALTFIQADAIEDISELRRRALIKGKWYSESRSSTQLPFRYISDNGIVKITDWLYDRNGNRTKLIGPVWKGLIPDTHTTH